GQRRAHGVVYAAISPRKGRSVARVPRSRVNRAAIFGEVDDTGGIRTAHTTAIAALVTARVEFEVVRRRPLQRQRIVLVAVVVGVLVTGLVVDVAVAGSLHAGQSRSKNVIDQW